jgi:hypothetical protein
MIELEPRSVQGLAFEIGELSSQLRCAAGGYAASPPIYRIAHYGISDVGEMHANLVRATRFKLGSY